MPEKIPTEAVKFAKKMGISFEGLEAEAEDIWGMLNDMSEKNFDEYQSFIQQQFKDQEKADARGEAGKDDKAKFFRPHAQFCVVTTSLSGDGIKVRITDAASRLCGKQVFINVCSHDVVEAPKDYYGNIIKDWSNSTDLQIPLVVGPLRDLDNQTSIAIDVVLNPFVMTRCIVKEIFKGQIIDLVIESVVGDKNIQLKKSWSLHGDCYMGGRGIDKKTPVLFPVNGFGDVARAKDTTKIMESPSMLLGAIKQEREEQSMSDEPALLSNKKVRAHTLQTCLHQSLTNHVLFVVTPSFLPEQTVQSSSSGPALKKGFLNGDSRPALYPEGVSGEGKRGATGGAYERLMSRCQVIDTRAVTQTPGPTSAVKTSTSTSTTTATASKASAMTAHRPTKTEVQQMESILSRTDDEWSSGSTSTSELDANELTKALEEMSRMLLGPGDHMAARDHLGPSGGGGPAAQSCEGGRSNQRVPSSTSPPTSSSFAAANDIVVFGPLGTMVKVIELLLRPPLSRNEELPLSTLFLNPVASSSAHFSSPSPQRAARS